MIGFEITGMDIASIYIDHYKAILVHASGDKAYAEVELHITSDGQIVDSAEHAAKSFQASFEVSRDDRFDDIASYSNDGFMDACGNLADQANAFLAGLHSHD